ncbi:high affinity immunoglobulin gamma Fc receptor I-like isoform X2, partial [Sigmodon hispidus]
PAHGKVVNGTKAVITLQPPWISIFQKENVTLWCEGPTCLEIVPPSGLSTAQSSRSPCLVTVSLRPLSRTVVNTGLMLGSCWEGAAGKLLGSCSEVAGKLLGR